MSVRSYPLWRLRLQRGLPRYLLILVSGLGLAASARYAIAPPRPIREISPAADPAAIDRAAEGYAVLFARRYLSWNGVETTPDGALENLVGGALEADAGLSVPTGTTQQVSWAEVVQAREPTQGAHVFTVAAQTDLSGLLYLTVGVSRRADGELALSGYPAFVGAPSSVPAQQAPHGQPIGDAALETVVRRGLGNYLSASTSELAADLTVGARVSLPADPLKLETFGHPAWTIGNAVLVVVQARDPRGVRYTLAYELDVARVRGRWEISAIQTDPRS